MSSQNPPQAAAKEQTPPSGDTWAWSEFVRPKTPWEFPEDLGDYLADLYHAYGGDNENVKFRHGCMGSSRYLHLLSTNGQPDPAKFRFWPALYTSTDTFFHPNTFVPCGKPSGRAAFDALYHVYAFAIDIDYRNDRRAAGYRDFLGMMEPLDYARAVVHVCLCDNGLPVPNYIEYGRNVRLVYILEEPIYARSKQGRDILKKLNRFQRYLVEKINEWDPCAHAETQGFEKGFRVPGSINGKNLAVVRMEKVSGYFYPFGELFDYLPPAISKEEFLRRKAEITNKKKKKLSAASAAKRAAAWMAASVVGATMAPQDGWPAKRGDVGCREASMLMHRLCALRSARQLPDIRREETTFVYTSTYQSLFGPCDTKAVAHEFNDGFPNPLPYIEVEHKLQKIRKDYKFRDETIADKTGIPVEFLRSGGVSLKPCAGKYKGVEARTKRGTYKINDSNKTKKLRRGRPSVSGSFDALFAVGMSAKDIAVRIGCSTRTVFRKLAAWRANGGKEGRETGLHAIEESRKAMAKAVGDAAKAAGAAAKAVDDAVKATDDADMATKTLSDTAADIGQGRGAPVAAARSQVPKTDPDGPGRLTKAS